MTYVLKLAMFLVLLTAFVAPAQAGNRDVCTTCTYTTISAAISAASNGDTIRVAEGTYTGAGHSISVNSGPMDLAFEGGYSANFAARNGETILSDVNIQFGPSYSGSARIDGFTITAGTGDAVYFASTMGDFSITNCRIFGNGQAAITISPYYPFGGPMYELRTSATYRISNNVIYDHHGFNYLIGAVGISFITPSSYSANVIVSDNLIHDITGAYASGIRITHSGNTDSFNISGNEIYGSQIGLYLNTTGTNSQFDIKDNDIHDNRYIGLQIYGAPSGGDFINVHHNRIYANAEWGVYHYNPRTSLYLNNVVAYHSRGIQLMYGSGSPTLKNNILYRNSSRDIFLSSDEAGYSGTSMIPAAVHYNNLYHPDRTPNLLHTGLPPAYSYNSEQPGDWNEMNQFAWTIGNYSEDPRFVDPENGNFHLQSNSFSIDEGSPSDSFAAEPVANGGRINGGAYGGTAEAETTPATVVVSNVAATQSSAGVSMSFDTTTSSHTTWLTAEYWDGAAYHQISPPQLTGTGYKIGYLSGRMPTGSGTMLSWTGAQSVFADSELNNAKIRLSVFHGNQATVAESPVFAIDYKRPEAQITSPLNGSTIETAQTPLTASALDHGMGVAAVMFRYKAQGGGTFTNLETDTAAPYQSSWAGANLLPGVTYVVQAVASDRAGNTITTPDVTFSIAVAPTPTPQPTAQPTAEPTAEPTAQPTAQPTAEPSAQPTAQPTATPVPSPESTPEPSPEPAPTGMPTPTPTEMPTPTVTPPPAPPSIVPSVNALVFSPKGKSKKLELRNRSTQGLEIVGMAVTGDSTFKPGRMKFPILLKPGKSKSLSVSFKSKTRGTFGGTLLLFTNDPNNRVIEITLQGTK